MKKITFFSLVTFLVLLFSTKVVLGQSTPTNFNAGAAVIDMGISPQTDNNGLKPYGLVVALVDAGVPVNWIIKDTKTYGGSDVLTKSGNDGIDLTVNGTPTAALVAKSTSNLKAGPFLIAAEFMVQATPIINAWLVKYGDTSPPITDTSKLTVYWNLDAINNAPVHGVITSIPNVLVHETGSFADSDIYKGFYDRAGINTGNFTAGRIAVLGKTGLPSDLGSCQQFYIMSHHSDPDVNFSQDDVNTLYNFITKGGNMWLGCHDVSLTENVLRTSNTSLFPAIGTHQLNFLSNSGLIPYKDLSTTTYPWLSVFDNYDGSSDSKINKHNNTFVNADIKYTGTAAGDPIMQFVGDIEPALNGNSEHTYIPFKTNGAGNYSNNPLGDWRPTTTVGLYDSGATDARAGGLTALVAYGPAYGNTNYGDILYTASHISKENGGGENEWVGEARLFGNFLFRSALTTAPEVTIAALTPNPTVCSDANLAAAAVLGTVPAGTKSYLWESSIVSGPGAAATFTAASSLSTSINFPTVTAVTVYKITFTLTITPSGCSNPIITKVIASVTVNPSPVIGTQPTGATVCVGGSSPSLSATASGGVGTLTYQWQSSTTSGGTYTNVPSAGTSSTYAASSTSTAGTTWYHVVVSNAGGGCPVTSNNVSVVVDPTSVGGSVAGSATVCTGTNSTTLTLSGNTGTITGWESSLDAFATAGTPIANTTTTLTATNLTATTSYRAIIKSGECSSTTSSTATVTVDPTSVGGSVAASPTPICSGGTSTITLTGYTGSIQWQTNASGSFVDISGETSATYATPALTTTTKYRAVVTSGVCSSSTSSVATVTVNSNTAITTQSTSPAPVCAGSTIGDITVAASGTGTVTYQWYSNTSASNTGGTLLTGETGTSYTPTNTTAGNYYYYAIATSSCSTASSSVATVVVNPLPPVPVASNQTVCSNGSPTQTLTATATGGTITWYTAATGGSLVASPTQVGVGSITYYAESSNETCSSLTRTAVTLTINANPEVTISGNSVLTCSNTIITLNASGSTVVGAASYLWSTGATTATINVSAAGNYSVTVTDGNSGCSATASVTVTGNATPPTATITGNAVLTCAVQSVTLDASATSVIGTASYLWNTGATTATIVVTAPGEYSVTVKDSSNGCSVTETVTVAQNTAPPVVNISGPTALTCNATSITLNASGSTVQGTASYLWNTGATTPSIQVNQAGDYTVVVTDSGNGCSNAKTITVTENYVAAEITGGSIALCIEDASFNLTSLLPSNFVSGGTWTDNMNSGGLTGINFDPSIVNLGDYEFTYREPGDCGRIITVTVNVNDDCVVLACVTIEDISKVVTPNGDGFNDTFKVGNDPSAAGGCKYLVKIFNRWGKMVFQSDNYQNNWEGRHDGSGMQIGSNNELPTGTYYYVVNIIDSTGNTLTPMTGYIYLGTH